MPRAPRADENEWSSNGPEGGRIYCISIHPFDNQVIYIGTIGNGIYKTTDGGVNWVILDDPVLDDLLRDIVFHPYGPDTMYAGTVEGMYRSFDGGNNWALLRPPGDWYNTISDIEIHPIYPNIIFAVGGHTQVKSTDGGNTWYDLDLPWVALTDIKTDPLRPDTIYGATQSAHHRYSIFRSENLGETWYPYHNNLDTALIAQDFQIDPVNSDIQYFGGIGHLYQTETCIEKTTNCGADWFDITPPGLIKPHITAITISPIDHNTIYICTQANGVLKSSDGGMSWSEINNGSKAATAWYVKVDSITGHLYLGTLYYGIYKSTDGGESWENISYNINNSEVNDLSINYRNPDTIYAAAMNGVFRSLDGALNWQPVEIDYPGPDVHNYGVAVDPYDPNYIFISYLDYGTPYPHTGGVYRSSDGGNNWFEYSDGLSSATILTKLNIADFENGNRRVFLSAIGLYYSDDLGENWNICQQGLPTNERYYQLEINKTDPFRILATTYSQIFCSIDGGDSWLNLRPPPGANLINSIVFDPQIDDKIYAARNYTGVYKSTDLGQRWIDISNNLPRDPEFFIPSGLAINPYNPENLFVNSRGHGIFISHNGGDYWEPYSEGLNTNYSQAITIIDPIDTCRIYMAPSIQSVWSITRTTTGVKDLQPSPERPFLLSNFPNPFNSSTTIKYDILKATFVSLEIYDILGRKIEVLVSKYQSPGSYSYSWDAWNYPSGIYMARIKTDNYSRIIKMILLK